MINGKDEMQIFLSQDFSTWTVVVVRESEGFACMVAAGNNLTINAFPKSDKPKKNQGDPA